MSLLLCIRAICFIYRSDPAELQNRVGPVKSQMHRNLAAVVERGENLSLLENRAGQP